MWHSGTAWRVTYACTHRDLPQAQGDALPIPRGNTLPQITPKGTPHHHKPTPPRGPWAQGGPLLTGRDVWAFVHLHHLPTGTEQGMLRKKTTFVSASSSFGNWRWVFSRQQAVRFNLHGCDASINKNWRCQGDTKSPPSWPCSAGLCRPGFSAAHLHQQCRLIRRKH